MRVALIQCAVTRRSRSANIARIMHLITAACERDPAPDLLVLPAGCEAGGRAAGPAGVTRAMGDAVAGLLAMQAREWGVFIAGGYLARDDDGPLVHGVLLDPDGDVLVRISRDDDAPCRPTCVRTTAIGALGLVLGGHVDDAFDERLERGDLVAVSGFAHDDAAAERDAGPPAGALRRLARRCGCYVCGAFPVFLSDGESQLQRRSGGPSEVYAPDGTRVARSPAREAIVVADIVSDAHGESG